MALAISLRRVALAWEALNESAPEARPEDPITRHGSNASANLLSALQALSDSQDNMLAVYLQHYKNRIDLFQDLGIMRFDERGMWIDEPLDRNLAAVETHYVVPPEIAQPLPDADAERAVPRDVTGEN